jgi:hypothetical protein
MRYPKFVAMSILGCTAGAWAQLTCPEMPSELTKVSRDVALDIRASAGLLGKVTAAEVGVKTDVTAKAMFERFPNLDRLLVLQMLSSTYCSALKSPDISAKERLDRWERFMERYLELRSVAAPVPPAKKKSNSNEQKEPTKPTPAASVSQGKAAVAQTDDDRYRSALAQSASGSVEAARTVFAILAERGHVRSQYQLGRAYALGEGGKQDYKMAFLWFGRAARAGFPAAQHNIAVMYQDGLGTSRDEYQAQIWFSEAARGGFTAARELLTKQGRSW